MVNAALDSAIERATLRWDRLEREKRLVIVRAEVNMGRPEITEEICKECGKVSCLGECVEVEDDVDVFDLWEYLLNN